VTDFEATVIDAVTGHMNGDHPEDNLLIVRAFGAPEATASTMVSLDAAGGLWRATDSNGDREVKIDWPDGPISERPQIRQAVVKLYQAACKQLGVPAREEHGAAPAGPAAQAAANQAEQSAEPGGQQHGGNAHAKPEDDGSFSYAIRTATWGDHSDSEGSNIMEDIMRMRGTRDDYTSLVVQHFYMYEALEDAASQLTEDPRFAALHPAALVRKETLEEDLELLLGADWRDKISAVPATVSYADRIREVAAERWLPGIIAHHYTRYLGDLSGGQMIAKRVKKQHGFERAGIAFYDFTELGSIADFKATYRAVLDELGEQLDAGERQRMIDEVRLAYRFNTEVFADMQRTRGTVAA
jgi:heme oxygenase